MRALGITSGIGSMLIGARDAGFQIVGNVEWRQYYHQKDALGQNTFTVNFPGAFFKEKITDLPLEEIERLMGADLVMGHPECGAYSQLSGANRDFRERRATDRSDIPLFVDLVVKIQPRFFVMDDLPPSMMAYPMSEYAAKLPDYDLYPEWVSNWGYGNVQKNRNRMFMVGSRKDEQWAFAAGEEPNPLTVKDVIGDLPDPRPGSNWPNHDPQDMSADCFRALNLGFYRKKNTWGEVQEHFRDKPGGHTLEYVREDGSKVKRIGFLKGHWDGPSHVMTGQNACLHNLRSGPYTIRERARIQGFPDDFVFYGTILNEKGEWNHDVNFHMVKQTGKAMPIQFCRYVSKQIMAHLQGENFEASGRRVIKPNVYVDNAKQWYCENVGYSDQERACGSCWLYQQCTIRARKYRIGEPAVGQRDLYDPGVVPVEPPRPPVRVRAARQETPRPAKEPCQRPPRRASRFSDSAPAEYDLTFGGK